MPDTAEAGTRSLPDPKLLPGSPWGTVGHGPGNALLVEEQVTDTVARWPSDTCSAWAMGILLWVWSGYEDYDGRGVIGYYGA